MKNAEEWLDENGYKNTEMWSRQGVYEVAIRLQHDHDNELISEIEKKIKIAEEWGLHITAEAFTEIINLIKEK